MEFHDIKEQHGLLWGEEVFRGWKINTHHLRFQASMKPRSKLLRLRALYLEWVETSNVCGRSCSTPSRLFSSYAPLHPSARPERPAHLRGVLEQFVQHFQHAFPRMRQLLAIRASQQEWPV